MRRGLASLIIGLSLMVASLSWAGFTLSRTILDPGRSERLADQLLENPEVRQALVLRMSDALEEQIPPEVPVPRGVIEAGAEAALDDPRIEALIRDGFVQVHQNALAGNDEPVAIDAGALGAAGRDALVEVRPELEPFLPPTPTVAVELPTTGLSWVGTVKDRVDRYTGIGAVFALLGASAAFVVASDRAAVLRRVAFWGYGAAAFWIVLGYGIPWLAGNLSPTSAAIATAAADVFFGAMIRPAIVIAVLSTVLLIIGFAWPSMQQRRGATVLQPRSGFNGSTPAAPQAEPATTALPASPPTGPVPDYSSRPAGDPWRQVGSTDNTDPMPIPTWADRQ